MISGLTHVSNYSVNYSFSIIMPNDVCRSTRGQHSANIIMLTDTPMANMQQKSWCLQVHQEPVSCMHCDVCRSTKGQHSACIVIFAQAPGASVLHVLNHFNQFGRGCDLWQPRPNWAIQTAYFWPVTPKKISDTTILYLVFELNIIAYFSISKLLTVAVLTTVVPAHCHF